MFQIVARPTIKRMMTAIAAIGALLAWGVDRERRARPLVDFTYHRFIENQPLVNPIKALAVEWNVVVLPDGRVIRIDDGPLWQGMACLKDGPGPKPCVVEVETDAGGFASVYSSRRAWFCGGSGYVAPVRIPLIARPVYLNYRATVGTGRVVRSSATSGLRKSPDVRSL